MKPDAPEPPDAQLILLRQQLILAQVRIMELEDVRDELSPRLVEAEKMLATAQGLADQKTGEAAHLAGVLSDLQGQCDHLRHMQHVTNEALNAVRAEAAALAGHEKSRLDEIENLHALTWQLAEAGRQQLQRLASLESELATARAESAARLERIGQLDAEQRTLKSSRSWRWTAWLRSLERALGGRKP